MEINFNFKLKILLKFKFQTIRKYIKTMKNLKKQVPAFLEYFNGKIYANFLISPKLI